ncbi:hypothetical protein C8R43DRAFT_1112801 [Mycena crocata]|nr:hypothetical protein C8R43DRAFT_1112801 [Mycena crocata]
MFGLSLMLAGSFSMLVAAQTGQTTFDQLVLPANDPQCCSQKLGEDFTKADPVIDCNTNFGTAFFNCLICSSQSGSLLPPGLSPQDIQGVADTFTDRCNTNGFPIQITIGAGGAVSVQTPGSQGSSPGGTGSPGSNGAPGTAGPTSSGFATSTTAGKPAPTGDSNTKGSDDSKSDPSSTSSSDSAASSDSDKKNGGDRIASSAGMVGTMVLGALFYTLI